MLLLTTAQRRVISFTAWLTTLESRASFLCPICRTNSEKLLFKDLAGSNIARWVQVWGSNAPVPKPNESLSKQAEAAEMSVYVRGRMACSSLHARTKHAPFKVIASSWTGHEWETSPPHHQNRKLNIFIPSVLVLLISLQVCLTAADARAIFSCRSSREPPVSLMPHISPEFKWGCVFGAGVPVECVCGCMCEKEGGGGLLFLSFLMNVAFLSFRSCHRCMHGCTRLEFICNKHIFTYDRCKNNLCNAHFL